MHLYRITWNKAKNVRSSLFECCRHWYFMYIGVWVCVCVRRNENNNNNVDVDDVEKMMMTMKTSNSERERPIWRWWWSEVKRYKAEKNAHNHFYDEQRNGSKGKILSFLSTQQQLYLLCIVCICKCVCVCVSFVFLLFIFSLRFFSFFCFSLLLFFCGFLNCWFQCFQTIEYAVLRFFFFVSFCSLGFPLVHSHAVVTNEIRSDLLCPFFFYSLHLRFHIVLNVFVYALNSELKASREQRLLHIENQENKQQEFTFRTKNRLK